MLTDNQEMRMKLIDIELKKLLRESYERELKEKKDVGKNRSGNAVRGDVPSRS